MKVYVVMAKESGFERHIVGIFSSLGAATEYMQVYAALPEPDFVEIEEIDVLKFACLKHPRYAAKRAPRAKCTACLSMWKAVQEEEKVK